VTAAEAAAAPPEVAAAVAWKRRQAWKTRQDAEVRWADLHVAAEAAFVTSQAAIKEANAATVAVEAAVEAAAAAAAAAAKGLTPGRAFVARWTRSTSRPAALSRASSIPRASTTFVAEAAAAVAAATAEEEEAAAATAAAAADQDAVWWCRLTVSTLVLKTHEVSALEATSTSIANIKMMNRLHICFRFQLAPLQHGIGGGGGCGEGANGRGRGRGDGGDGGMVRRGGGADGRGGEVQI